MKMKESVFSIIVGKSKSRIALVESSWGKKNWLRGEKRETKVYENSFACVGRERKEGEGDEKSERERDNWAGFY